jgi:hypothetical protein
MQRIKPIPLLRVWVAVARALAVIKVFVFHWKSFCILFAHAFVVKRTRAPLLRYV